VELGAASYSGFSRVNGAPSGNLIIYLSPGANAVATADRVRQFCENAKKTFPAGLDYSSRTTPACLSALPFTK